MGRGNGLDGGAARGGEERQSKKSYNNKRKCKKEKSTLELTHTKKIQEKKTEIKARRIVFQGGGGGRRNRRGDENLWFSLRQGSARVESPGAQVLPLAGLSSSLKGLGPRRTFAGTGGRLVKRDYIMGFRPYPPSSPLTPHQDFAERNGFCTRSFFIIKLTVSTPSSWPRLLPGEATPPFLPGSA